MAKKNGEEVMKNVDRRNKRQGPEQKTEQVFNPSKRLNTGTPSGTIQTTNAICSSMSNVSRGQAVIMEKYGAHGCNVGEDGGFGPNISRQVFPSGTKYDLDYKSPNKSGQNFKSGEDMIDLYKELCADPFDKEDWEHVKYFSSLGIFQVVGDGLLMSSPKCIERAIWECACNALLLKKIASFGET
ncbi:phosphopyruvate hydratase [Sarracenia purpurea var. burkii]